MRRLALCLYRLPEDAKRGEAASVASDPGRPANESQRQSCQPLFLPSGLLLPPPPHPPSSASNLQTEMLPNGIAPISIKRNFIGKFDI